VGDLAGDQERWLFTATCSRRAQAKSRATRLELPAVADDQADPGPVFANATRFGDLRDHMPLLYVGREGVPDFADPTAVSLDHSFGGFEVLALHPGYDAVPEEGRTDRASGGHRDAAGGSTGAGTGPAAEGRSRTWLGGESDRAAVLVFVRASRAAADPGWT